MRILDRVPEDRPFVVSPSRQYYARQALPAVTAGTLVAVFALVGVTAAAQSGAGWGWWVGLGAVELGALAFAVGGYRMWRNALYRGPAFAADANGMWLRLDGGGTRPRVGYLTWPEITRVRVQIWKSPRGNVPFLCLEAPRAVAEATADPVVARATRRAIQVFGTPFVISDRRVETDLGTMLRALRDARPEIIDVEDL
jgi:hypothetical protein